MISELTIHPSTQSFRMSCTCCSTRSQAPSDFAAAHLLKPKEVAKILGAPVSTLRRLAIPTVELPSRGVGVRKHLRYLYADVYAFAHNGSR